ncbi:MAG: hypothetical protein KH382_08545 [Clostridiales bacterium]|jgi:hypothetical protein|nr:hypothetical protein [Clostridiales bacterium]
MKKTKWISILTALAMTLSVFSLSASSLNLEIQEEEAMITDKMVFAAEMGKKYEAALSKGEIVQSDIASRDELMMQYMFASDEEREEISELLEQRGVYVYSVGENAASVTNEEPSVSPTSIWYPTSGSGDVEMQAPIIYYEAWEDSWTVTCGGQWKNDNWRPYLPGTTGNLGDVDAFGVGYTNIKSSYNSYVIRSCGYLTDQNGNNMVSTNNRSDGDGSIGFGFRLQDKVSHLPSLLGEYLYVGYKWYGSCTYDAKFSTYSGVATAYYTHTYSTATINSVKFGVNGKIGGVEVDISNKEVSFTAYSNDTPLRAYGLE